MKPEVTRYVYTFIIYTSFATYGILATTTASTLLDLAELMNCASEQIAVGLSIRAIAYSVSALTCGWLFDRLDRQVGLIIALTGCAAFSLPVPLIRSLNYYLFTQAINGIGYSAIDVAASAWILQLWSHRSNTFMQALHFCFSIGDAIAPLIVRPYLSTRRVMDGNHTTSDPTVTKSEESRIHIPYIIVSCIAFAVSVLLISWHTWESCCNKSKKIDAVVKEETMETMPAALSASCKTDTVTRTASDRGYTIELLLLGCLLLTFCAGMEFNTLNFLPTFAVFCGLRFSNADGALMLSVLSIAYSVTRALSIPISTKLSSRTMIYGNMIILLSGNLLLLAFSSTDSTMVWVAVIIIGIGNGSTMPAIFSFLSDKMTTTNTIIGIFTFSRSVSQSMYALVTGFLMRSTPLVFVYVNLVSGVFSCIILLMLERKRPNP